MTGLQSFDFGLQRQTLTAKTLLWVLLAGLGLGACSGAEKNDSESDQGTGGTKNTGGTDNTGGTGGTYNTGGTDNTGGQNQGGMGGADGGDHETLVTKTTIAPGSDCSFGGSRTDTGIDDDDSGVLDPDEVDSSEFLCNLACEAALTVVTVDFRDYDTSNVASFVEGELTVTATPGDVSFLKFNGIGAVGGVRDTEVEANESLVFTFSTPVLNVSYYVGTARNIGNGSTLGDRNIEAFAPDGQSYGVAQHTDGGSSLLTVPNADALVASFTDVVSDDSHLVRSVTYSVCR